MWRRRCRREMWWRGGGGLRRRRGNRLAWRRNPCRQRAGIGKRPVIQRVQAKRGASLIDVTFLSGKAIISGHFRNSQSWRHGKKQLVVNI